MNLLLFSAPAQRSTPQRADLPPGGQREVRGESALVWYLVVVAPGREQLVVRAPLEAAHLLPVALQPALGLEWRGPDVPLQDDPVPAARRELVGVPRQGTWRANTSTMTHRDTHTSTNTSTMTHRDTHTSTNTSKMRHRDTHTSTMTHRDTH